MLGNFEMVQLLLAPSALVRCEGANGIFDMQIALKSDINWHKLLQIIFLYLESNVENGFGRSKQ